MGNVIKIKRGSGVPSSSNDVLEHYELGYRTGTTELYINDGGTYRQLGGGGGDADTLDGINSTSFLRSDANDTASGVITFSNRVTSTGTDGFTIGNYAGYDRIVNNSNVFRFLTDGDAYANMQFATVTAGTWQGTAIANAYIANLPASKITSGTFADARIPSLAASKITSGTFADARIASASEWNEAYTWGNHASAGYLTSFDITTQTDPKYLRSNAADTSTGKITFSNGMQDNVSNVGTVGSTGLEGNQLTEQNWADFPVGFGGMMRSGNQSYGNPGSTYFYFHKIANRDSGGGWGGIAVGYSNNAELYVGTTTVNTSYATWSKIWNESNLGISNLANDRILTGNGSSSIRGESNVTINSSNNLTIGGGGQLTLTGGTNAVINVNSTADSFIEKDSGTNLYLANNVQDGDLLLRVNDGGTNKTAISIDASDNARVKLPYDNQRLAIGAGQDIQFNHDGSNSYFDNYTGQLYITNNQDDGDIIFRTDNGSGGVTNYLQIDGGAEYVYFHKDIALKATEKLYLDGGGNSYIWEESADNVMFYIGGRNMLRLHENNGEVIVNDSNVDTNFRVEGNTHTHLLFTDAGNNNVGIRNSSPWTSTYLDVGGADTSANMRIGNGIYFYDSNRFISRNGNHIDFTSTNGTMQMRDGVSVYNKYATGGDQRNTYNHFAHKVTGNQAGAFICNTDIPRASNRMTILHFEGYAYGDSSVIDFKICFYPYSGVDGQDGVAGRPLNYSIVDNGNDGRQKFIGVNSSGNIAVAIGDYDDPNKYYWHYHVNILQGHNDADLGSWTGTTSTTNGFGWLDKRTVYAPFFVKEEGGSQQSHHRVTIGAASEGNTFRTDSGFITLGPKNGSYAHLETDRASFYFNKKLTVDEGVVQSYNEDLSLRRAEGSADRIDITDSYTRVIVNNNEEFRVDASGALTSGQHRVTSEYQVNSNGTTLRRYVGTWNSGQQTHDVIYNAYASNFR